jgi:predicted transcriptional regulator
MTQEKKPLVVTTLRLDPAVVAKLDKIAKADKRSRSSLLQKIIAEWAEGAK